MELSTSLTPSTSPPAYPLPSTTWWTVTPTQDNADLRSIHRWAWYCNDPHAPSNGVVLQVQLLAASVRDGCAPRGCTDTYTGRTSQAGEGGIFRFVCFCSGKSYCKNPDIQLARCYTSKRLGNWLDVVQKRDEMLIWIKDKQRPWKDDDQNGKYPLLLAGSAFISPKTWIY